MAGSSARERWSPSDHKAFGGKRRATHATGGTPKSFSEYNFGGNKGFSFGNGKDNMYRDIKAKRSNSDEKAPLSFDKRRLSDEDVASLGVRTAKKQNKPSVRVMVSILFIVKASHYC